MSKVVGIDLGTTNSLVAYVKDGVPTVIRDKSGDALLPGSDNTIRPNAGTNDSWVHGPANSRKTCDL
jgi:molecular chaperone DnaK (HSP70)